MTENGVYTMFFLGSGGARKISLPGHNRGTIIYNGAQGVPPPQKNFQFWGLERRILVHSVALLSADCTAAFCTVIYSADAISVHKIRERILFPEQFFYTIIM